MTAPRPTAKMTSRPEAVPTPTNVPYAFVHINKCGGSSVEIALGITKRHATAGVLRQEMGAEEWSRRLTFSIVRNPFDRVVSIYYFRVRTDQGGLADRHLNLNQWVERVWADEDPQYRDDTILFAPAADWLCVDGELIVDEIAKLENLRTDWVHIAEKLGVDHKLPLTNANLHPTYDKVLNLRSREILERAFARDLEMFDYSF